MLARIIIAVSVVQNSVSTCMLNTLDMVLIDPYHDITCTCHM